EIGPQLLDFLIELLGKPQQVALLTVLASHAKLAAVNRDGYLRHDTLDLTHGSINYRLPRSRNGWAGGRNRAAGPPPGWSFREPARGPSRHRGRPPGAIGRRPARGVD